MMNKRFAYAVLGCFSGLAAFGATTWHVAPEGDDGNNTGDSWSSPLATPNAALQKSERGDTILLSNGVYRLTKIVWIGAAPSGAGWEVAPEGKNVQDLKIVGLSDNPEDVVLDGQGQVGCIYCRNRATFRNLTTRNAVGVLDAYGYLQGHPAGIFSNSGGTTVSNCIVRGCVNRRVDGYGANGGGLSIIGPSSYVYDTLVEDCIVSNVITAAAANKNGAALSGGGAHFASGAFVTNCVFRNNRVVQDGDQGYESYLRGGGVNIEGSTMVDCRIYGNSLTNLHGKTAGCGGGVAVMNGSRVENCLIYDNTSTCGGAGVYMGQTTSSNDDNGILRMCTITNNTAYVVVPEKGSNGRGSGVLVTGKNDLVENCLIGWNTFKTDRTDKRPYEGGGLGIGYMNDANTTNVVVRDSMIVNNTSPVCGGIKIFRSSDVTVSNCVIRGNTATVGEWGAYSSEGLHGGLFADCWFLDNKATTYGAWLGHANYGSLNYRPVRVRNSFVAGNTSNAGGTYITTYQYSLPLIIENCTIVSNNVGSTRAGFVTGNPWATTAYIPNSYSNLFVDSCVVLRNGHWAPKYNGIYDFSTVDLDKEKPYEGANYNMTLVPTNVRRTVTSANAKIAFTAENGNIPVDFTDTSIFRDAAAGDYRPASGSAPMVGKSNVAAWMGNSRRAGAHDLGDGTYAVSKKGKYGVTIVRNNAVPRRSSTGLPTCGCFEWFVPPGFTLFLR